MNNQNLKPLSPSKAREIGRKGRQKFSCCQEKEEIHKRAVRNFNAVRFN